jgi:3-oxoacyl-[acyl-carrier-protein] synthase-3
MTKQRSVGIHGIGLYLPSEVRTNDWWPESVVSSWRERRAGQRSRELMSDRPAGDVVPVTDGVSKVLDALSVANTDPFNGVVERRVMPKGMLPSEMEIAAGKEALAKSEIDPEEIGLLLTHSYCPDVLNVPNACTVHRELGLSTNCLSLATDGACNSFLQQLTLAEQMIASGRTRYALLVQSSASSRLVHKEDPSSIWFGDAATAVVVGPVSEGKGVLGSAHRTDGTLSRTIMCGIPGKHWYDEGQCVLYVGDAREGRRMILTIADLASDVTRDVLAQAGLEPGDVRFYASHQGTSWLRAITQEHVGLRNARSVDTFSWTASLVACNIPAMLALGAKEGLLRDGDPALLFSGGSGITWSAIVLRWGK